VAAAVERTSNVCAMVDIVLSILEGAASRCKLIFILAAIHAVTLQCQNSHHNLLQQQSYLSTQPVQLSLNPIVAAAAAAAAA
jgi:hypothetical protein